MFNYIKNVKSAIQSYRGGNIDEYLNTIYKIPLVGLLLKRKTENLLREIPPLSPKRFSKKKNLRILFIQHFCLPLTINGYSIRSINTIGALTRKYMVFNLLRLNYPTKFNWRKIARYKDLKFRLISSLNASHLLNEKKYLSIYLRKALDFSKQKNVNVIYAASNYVNGYIGLCLSHKINLPFVYELRGLWHFTRCISEPGFKGTELFRLRSKLELEICRKADQVVAISEALKNYLVANGIKKEKISVIQNSLDVSRFEDVKPDPKLVETLGLGNSFVIGYIGSFQVYEGIERIVKVMLDLTKARKDLNVKALLIGNGAQLGDIEASIKELGLEDYFVMIKSVDPEQVANYYSICNLMLYPRHKNMLTNLIPPIKILEPLFLGIPVLVSNLDPIRELLPENYSNFVEEKDWGMISEKLIQCNFQFSNDPSIKTYIKEKFSLDALEHKYEKVFNKYIIE